jgi:hypothetical protein
VWYFFAVILEVYDRHSLGAINYIISLWNWAYLQVVLTLSGFYFLYFFLPRLGVFFIVRLISFF